MWKYHIRLKTSTFQSSKFIKRLSEELSENKNFCLNSLIIKHNYLTILNCDSYKCWPIVLGTEPLRVGTGTIKAATLRMTAIKFFL